MLQARILVTLFHCVLITPNSHFCCSFQLCSCCSKLVFKCCFSRLCYCYSKLLFECCSSQLCSSTPSSHFWYLKLDILQKTFRVAFGFLIFCFMFWPLFSSYRSFKMVVPLVPSWWYCSSKVSITSCPSNIIVLSKLFLFWPSYCC
jgi:hypothetical protein